MALVGSFITWSLTSLLVSKPIIHGISASYKECSYVGIFGDFPSTIWSSPRPLAISKCSSHLTIQLDLYWLSQSLRACTQLQQLPIELAR
jgi:hypothetical protein